MVMTTVLVDCATCGEETTAKYKDCDSCYERFLETGADSTSWTADQCEHLQCLGCGESPF